MSSSVEDGLELVRNKSHVWGSVSEFGLGLGSEVQMRTNRQEFWTHMTLGLPEPYSGFLSLGSSCWGMPRTGDARREPAGYAHVSPIT